LGFYLNEVNQCALCSTPGCMICYNDSACQQCNPSFKLDASSGSCVPCT
jgi:hypothetical protein